MKLILLLCTLFVIPLSAQEVSDSLSQDKEYHSNVFIYEVTANLNIRTQGSTDSESVGTFKPGTLLYVDGEFLHEDNTLDEWVFGRNTKGKSRGWVSSKYLSYVEEYMPPDKYKIVAFGKSRSQISQILIYILLATSIAGIIFGGIGINEAEYGERIPPIMYIVQFLLLFEGLAFALLAYWTYHDLASRYMYDALNGASAFSIFYAAVNAIMFFVFALGYIVLVVSHCVMLSTIAKIKHSWLTLIMPLGLMILSLCTGNWGFISPFWMEVVDIDSEYAQMAIYGSLFLMLIYAIWIFVKRKSLIDAILYVIVYPISMVGLMIILPTITWIFVLLLALMVFAAIGSVGALAGVAGGSGGSSSNSDDGSRKLRNGQTVYKVPGGGLGEQLYETGGISNKKYKSTDGGNTFSECD